MAPTRARGPMKFKDKFTVNGMRQQQQHQQQQQQQDWYHNKNKRHSAMME